MSSGNLVGVAFIRLGCGIFIILLITMLVFLFGYYFK
jgi:hypothetical protein